MSDFEILKGKSLEQARLPGLPAPPGRDPAERTRAATEASVAARRRRLSPRQRLFVESYLQSLNASDAARRAGYADAEVNSKRILDSPAVRAAIEASMEERRARHPYLEQRVLEELCRIAFADPRALFRWGPDGVELRPIETLSPEEAAAVCEVSEGRGGVIRLKKHDKVKALELLGKHFGMFADRLHAEVSGPDGAPLREDKRILVQFVSPREGGGVE